MRIWNLDNADYENCDIKVYLPGPPGPPMVSVGSFTSPVTVSGSIVPPIYRWQRSFIHAGSPVNQPTIANPSDNGSWVWIIQVVGGSSITLNDASNIKLSGQWIGSPDSIICLIWDGNSRYVEDHRNEI